MTLIFRRSHPILAWDISELGPRDGDGVPVHETVDGHHDRARARGTETVYPPVDQPYDHREYSARDADGGLWSLMRALGESGAGAAQRDPLFVCGL